MIVSFEIRPDPMLPRRIQPHGTAAEDRGGDGFDLPRTNAARAWELQLL